MSAASPDGIAPETLAAAEQAEREAAELPSADEIRVLAEHAMRHGGAPGMSKEDVARLADKAVEQAEQMTSLLRQIRDMVRAERDPEAGADP
jgi:hypothetical protein